jgi:hypothetical protein
MKTVLLMMILLTSSIAFADCNREAQFVGNVKNLKTKSTSFSFQLGLGRWFSPSIVCPMDEEEFVSAIVEIEGKPLIANGDEISGVLVFDQKTQTYRID